MQSIVPAKYIGNVYLALVADTLELKSMLVLFAQEESLCSSIFRNFTYSYTQNSFKIGLDVWLGDFQGH